MLVLRYFVAVLMLHRVAKNQWGRASPPSSCLAARQARTEDLRITVRLCQLGSLGHVFLFTCGWWGFLGRSYRSWEGSTESCIKATSGRWNIW